LAYVPRFFFDIHDGELQTVDRDGVELGDERAAQNEAVRALAEIAADALPDGVVRAFIVEVRDAASHRCLRATLSLRVERLE